MAGLQAFLLQPNKVEIGGLFLSVMIPFREYPATSIYSRLVSLVRSFCFYTFHKLRLENSKNKNPAASCGSNLLLRREGDSNPRSRGAGQQFSRLPRSATPASLHNFDILQANKVTHYVRKLSFFQLESYYTSLPKISLFLIFIERSVTAFN